MEKISLMTMTMFLRIFFKFQTDHDKEELIEEYQEMLDLVQKSGFQMVDVTSWEVNLIGIECVKKMLAEHGLSVSSFITFGEYARMDKESFAGRVEQGKLDVDTAAALGTDVLMLVPQAYEGIEQYTPEKIRARMSEHWKPIVEYAKEKGLRAMVEDTPDMKLHLCKAADVLEVLDMVPGLELVYDTANMTLAGEDPFEYLQKFIGRIGYVHLKDYRPTPPGSVLAECGEDGTKMSVAPVGTGLIDIRGIVEALKKSGYAGGMTMEFIVDDDGDFLKSLKRNYGFLRTDSDTPLVLSDC